VLEEVKRAAQSLYDGTCTGVEMTGWRTWPTDYDREEFARIKATAEKIRGDSPARQPSLPSRSAFSRTILSTPARCLHLFWASTTLTSRASRRISTVCSACLEEWAMQSKQLSYTHPKIMIKAIGCLRANVRKEIK